MIGVEKLYDEREVLGCESVVLELGFLVFFQSVWMFINIF